MNYTLRYRFLVGFSFDSTIYVDYTDQVVLLLYALASLSHLLHGRLKLRNIIQFLLILFA